MSCEFKTNKMSTYYPLITLIATTINELRDKPDEKLVLLFPWTDDIAYT